jgi:leucyl/phenylalanyl-tRNA--protein transferase
MRRARRKFEIRTDTAFLDIVDACADERRPHGWISPQLRTTYECLYELGRAHSVEAWRVDDNGGEHLAGGLFGVAIGGFFSAESMFHAETDGSKAAVAGLIEVVAAAGDVDRRLIDVQLMTPHLASLGVVAIPRRDYLRRLASAMTLDDAFGRRPCPRESAD